MEPILKVLCFLLFVVFLTASVAVSALQAPPTLTLTQLHQRISTAKGDTIVIENLRVAPTESEVTQYVNASTVFFDTLFTAGYRRRYDSFTEAIVQKPILFRNVDFTNLYFVKTTFLGHVEFLNCTAPEVAFSFCRFERGITITGVRVVRAHQTRIPTYDNSTLFDNCEVRGLTVLRANELRATMFNSSFNEVILDVFSTHAVRCTFRKTSNEPLHTLVFVGPGLNSTEASQHEYLALWLCTFEDPTGLATFWLQSEYDNLTMSGCEFNLGVVLGFNWVNKMLWLEGNRFNKFLDMGDLSLPVDNSNLQDWKSIEGKVIVRGENLGYPSTYIPYYPDSDDRLQQVYYYRYLAMLTKFMAIYKIRGDITSYNNCFIHRKLVEEKRLDLVYRQDPSLRSWLDLRLSNFLRTFSSYGTDYTSAILFSIYVILLFSLIFFLFPSEEDNLTRHRFMQFFEKAIEYFKTDKQLTQFFQEKREKEIAHLESFHRNLKASRENIPGILTFLGQPFYRISISINEMQIWLLKRTDLVRGRWNELSRNRKIWIGTLVTGYAVGFVMSGLIMRAVNAMALSLNSFVTLGYGEITAKGIGRYLAVVEGIIGWFLLALFSASLVSQLLQQ